MKLQVDGTMRQWSPQRFIIMGYTGKDQEAVQKHVDELAELGIPAPPKVPMIYEVTPELIQTAQTVTVVGNEGSGEAEVVLLDIEGTWYVGLGSDHTDRVLEAVSIQKSKQVCAKPIATELWSLDSIVNHWDDIEIKSWVDVEGEERLYQSGTLGEFLHPRDLTKIAADRGYMSPGIAIFCGTLPLLEGQFHYSPQFRAELYDPHNKRTIRLEYRVEPLKDAEKD